MDIKTAEQKNETSRELAKIIERTAINLSRVGAMLEEVLQLWLPAETQEQEDQETKVDLEKPIDSDFFLKPCPFCGNKSFFDWGKCTGTMAGFDYVSCDDCGATVEALRNPNLSLRDCENAAFMLWNTRFGEPESVTEQPVKEDQETKVDSVYDKNENPYEIYRSVDTDGTYWYITDFGALDNVFMHSYTGLDKYRYDYRNFFRTKERAEEVADKIKNLLIMEQLKNQYCPDYKPDFENENQKKWVVFRRYGKWEKGYAITHKQDTVYYDSEETAEKICEYLNKMEVQK